MKRRHYLALTGASIGSPAGCVGRSTDGSPATSSNETTTTSHETTTTSVDRGRRVSMGQTVTVGNVRVTVENPRVRKAVTAMGVHGSNVLSTAGQFVVVDVTVDGSSPDVLEDVTLRSSVDGAPISDGDPVPLVDGGEFAFPFPAERHETAAVRWDTGGDPVYWDLPATTRETLAKEPVFRVEEFAVPRRDGRLVLDLTVANDGERDGQFRAEVSMDAFSGKHVVQFPVPAGESRRYSGGAGKILLYFENNGGGTLTVTYPGTDGMTQVERTVEVSEPTTTSSG